MTKAIKSYRAKALLVGYAALGERADFIAKELGVSEDAVLTAWAAIKLNLFPPTLTIVPASKPSEPVKPAPKLKYQPRKVRALPGMAKRLDCRPKDMTAVLMGDPSAAEAERARCNPAPFRPELKWD